MELNKYAKHSINTKSDYVTLTLGIGAQVHMRYSIMFRHTFLPNIIEIHQAVQKNGGTRTYRFAKH